MIIKLYRIDTNTSYRNDSPECYYMVSDTIENAISELKSQWNVGDCVPIKDDEVFNVSRIGDFISLDMKAINRVLDEDNTNN